MSELTSKLRAAGEQHKGTDLGALLQWAVLHIESQDEALGELREAHQDEERERLRLERAVYESKKAIESALAAISAPLCPPVELGRDFAPQINLMAGHGDPDYLKSNGQSIRHVDTRSAKPKRASVRAEPFHHHREPPCKQQTKTPNK